MSFGVNRTIRTRSWGSLHRYFSNPLGLNRSASLPIQELLHAPGLTGSLDFQGNFLSAEAMSQHHSGIVIPYQYSRGNVA